MTKLTSDQRGELLRVYCAKPKQAQSLALSFGVSRYYPTILAARERAKKRLIKTQSANALQVMA